MKIIIPQNHPLIKQIKACPTITGGAKKAAISEIIKILTDETYQKRIHMAEWFMNDYDVRDSVASVFQWKQTIKGYEFWLSIYDQLRAYDSVKGSEELTNV